MSNLPNSAIRLVPPSLRAGYCPASWTAFAQDIVAGTSAQPNLRKGTTFYNFGSTAPYPPAPTPEPPPVTNPCGDCGPQDMLVDWEPSGIDLNELMTFRYFPDFAGTYATEPLVDCLSFNQTSNEAMYYIDSNQNIQTIAFPNLVHANQIFIRDCHSVTSVDLSKLESATGNTMKSYWFWNPDYGIYIDGFVSITTVNLGENFVGTNGKKYYFDTDMPQAGVDNILRIFANGVAFTSGELSVYGDEPPSATGYGYKATIQARGVTVYTA